MQKQYEDEVFLEKQRNQLSEARKIMVEKKLVRLELPDGSIKTLEEISEITGINLWTIKGRHRRGWNAEKILSTPLRKRTRRIEI